jgi:hypothetical protein
MTEWFRGQTVDLVCRFQKYDGELVIPSGTWCEVCRFSGSSKIILSSGLLNSVAGESGMYSYAYFIPYDFTPLDELCYVYFHGTYEGRDKIGEQIFKISSTVTASGAIAGAVATFDHDMPTAVFNNDLQIGSLNIPAAVFNNDSNMPAANFNNNSMPSVIFDNDISSGISNVPEAIFDNDGNMPSVDFNDNTPIATFD